MFMDDVTKNHEESHSFIVLIFEKQIRKRQPCKNDMHEFRLNQLHRELQTNGVAFE